MTENKSKTIEEQYQKLTLREQVLLRPDTYIGSIEIDEIDMWVATDVNNPYNTKIEKQKVKYIPGFVKLFDEILTNASDQVTRGKNVKNIHVNIFNSNSDIKISVSNDGDGIPIEIHKIENCYVPEMIFGHLLTGSNYDDKEVRFGGGRNGLGAKLTNIFSKSFKLETFNKGKSYSQEWANNMTVCSKPIVNKGKGLTKITYIPDNNYVNKNNIDIYEDFLKIALKRTIDIAVFCKDIKVYFNDTLLKINSLADWAKLHLEDESVIYSETVNDRFDLCVTESFKDNFEQVSIVNGISTHIGGSHVNYITNQIVNGLIDEITKGNKKLKIRASDVKSKLFLFLVSKIPNPTFDTQTKENLTTKMSKDITLDATVTPQFIKKLAKSSIVQSILDWLALKEAAELSKISKSSGKKVKIAKLEDAYNAGTSKSIDCALFLAEGECIDENTIIKVFKDDDYVSIKVKDANIGDMVITHNGNIRQIYGITKKVKKCLKINYNNTSISCSYEHKLLVYNKIIKKFMYLKVSDINKNIHQLVRSKLFNLESVIEIKNIESIDDDKFKLRLFINNSYIDTSLTHKFTILNIDYNKFELKTADNLNKGDLLISILPS